MKENLTTVVGKPVDIELVESIMRGSERCKFVVQM